MKRIGVEAVKGQNIPVLGADWVSRRMPAGLFFASGSPTLKLTQSCLVISCKDPIEQAEQQARELSNG